MESGILWNPRYKERVYIRPLRYALHFILVQIRVLVTQMKMAPKAVKRLTVKAKSKKKGKGSSVKRKLQGKNQKGGSSIKRKPKRKNQKGGFILSPGFIRNDPFTRMADSALDYDRRKQQARKRGKKFKRKKTSDDIWGFIERNLG